ncbi:MAG: M48 family metalloprotease [Candidatus Omnitrophota bacterium]
MRTFRFIQLMAVISVVLSVPYLAGFINRQYNVATGKDELLIVSTQQEKKIGSSVAEKVEKKYAETDDPLVQKRIEEIGARIAHVCERRDIAYRFKVLKAEKEEEGNNAFALPGGYIFIFEKFVETLGSDQAIAAVLAHEVGHVAAKHSIQRMQSGIGANLLMLVGARLANDRATVAEADDAINHMMFAYSREAELEADMLSVRYMKAAGFSPEGVVESLVMMRDIRKNGPIRNYIYYRSHPYLSERIAAARAELRGKSDFDSFINIPEGSLEH